MAYTSAVVREQKGKSLLAFPENYVVIDLETTGLSPADCGIIEAGGVKVRNGEIVDRFSELMVPDKQFWSSSTRVVNGFITSLTGITNKMLKSARSERDVLADFFDFIGEDSMAVGHNVNFDVNFLYDARIRLFGKPFSNDFIDTLRMSKKLHPDMSSHSLDYLSRRFGIDYSHAHRAVNDCEITQECLVCMQKEYALHPVDLGTAKAGIVKAKDIVGNPAKHNPAHPLYGKQVVISGDLTGMKRKEAMQRLADLGAVNSDHVTMKTMLFVVGKDEPKDQGKDFEKAKNYSMRKLPISIVMEEEFLRILNS